MHKYLLIPKSQKTYKIRFHFKKQLITYYLYNFDEYTYILWEKTNFRKIILIFSPILFHLNLIYTLGTRESSPAPSLISPVEQFSASEYFRNRTNPIFAYSRESTRCHLHTGHSN